METGENKYKVKKDRFLDWYYSNRDDVLDLAESLSYDSDDDMKTLVNETCMLLINNQDYILNI